MNDIVIAFDTTGSMAPCIRQVREKVQELCSNIFEHVPDVRVGIVAFGDYRDNPNYFHLSPTSSKYALTEFVGRNHTTHGGDADEFYELVVKRVREETPWREGAKKTMILIGDAEPHEPGYYYYGGITYSINWREEIQKSADAGITIFAIHALPSAGTEKFYRRAAAVTNGVYLQLNQFEHITEYLAAISYKASGQESRLDDFEKGLRTTNRSILNMFDSLRGRTRVYEDIVVDGEKLIPVDPSRFQVLKVRSDISIKDFVEDSGATFKIGRGFYQFTKTETIQERKEVVLRDKKTGDMFTGDQARRLIGIRPGERARLSPARLAQYDVFVQSTSSNRKLLGNSNFLYEVS